MGKVLDEEIKKIVLEALKDEKLEIDENTDLTTVGMDSFTFIYIVEKLEEKYECEIDDEKLFIPQMNTLKKLVTIMNETVASTIK